MEFLTIKYVPGTRPLHYQQNKYLKKSKIQVQLGSDHSPTTPEPRRAQHSGDPVQEHSPSAGSGAASGRQAKGRVPKAIGPIRKGEGSTSHSRKWREPDVQPRSPSARAPGLLSRRPFVFGTVGSSAPRKAAKRSEPQIGRAHV